jgi:UDP-N-acetylbacillosamine N-acetyltransferase
MKSREKIFIWGAGGHGRVLLNIFRERKKYQVIGFIDNDPKLKNMIIDGVKVIGDETVLPLLLKRGVKAGIVGIGDNQKRRQIAHHIKERGFSLINAIGTKSIIVPNVLIGEDVTIWAGTIINAYAKIGDNTIINCGAIVEHECIIGNGAHIGPGAKLAGRVKIGENAFVGIGATVIEGRQIGKNSIIGAGAVVLSDIPDNVVVGGVPAKIIKKLKNK